jgi:virulence-associated protein VagC
MHGRSQAVRLPLAFRLPKDRVRVRRVASGILLEPMVTDIDAWFAALDRFAECPLWKGAPRIGCERIAARPPFSPGRVRTAGSLS